ncbi:MAG TPA: DUF4129 domain-containing protein [Chitinophaga sp.]
MLACIMLPFLLSAQELDTLSLSDVNVYGDTTAPEETAELEAPATEQEVRTHSFWDQAVPVNVDSTEEWWVNGGLVQRKVPDDVLSKLRADKDLQYDKEKKAEVRNDWVIQVLMALVQFLYSIRLLIIVLLVAGLLLLVYYFMRQQGFRFRKKAEEELPDTEEIDPGVTGYEKQVQEAIAGGHFRQAVRFLHLQTLRLMADRELIVLGKDKTNADYLRVLLKTQWYQPFARLTRDYEYIWYGEVNVNADQFNRIHGQFRQFINELGFTR